LATRSASILSNSSSDKFGLNSLETSLLQSSLLSCSVDEAGAGSGKGARVCSGAVAGGVTGGDGGVGVVSGMLASVAPGSGGAGAIWDIAKVPTRATPTRATMAITSLFTRPRRFLGEINV